MSGQISGRVPNHLTQQNGHPLSISQMQTLAAGGGGHGAASANAFTMGSELHKARIFMQHKVHEYILQKHPQVASEPHKQRIEDLVKRLEEGLFKAALTKEEYLNLSTLESRLYTIISRLPATNMHNQRLTQFASSAPFVGAMIPTPGLTHTGNSNLIASSMESLMNVPNGGDTIPPMMVNSRSMLTTSGMLYAGCQQSSANLPISGGGGKIASMGMQRMVDQMIPTPGYNSSSCGQSYMNKESVNNGVSCSAIESTVLLQPQRPRLGGQNSRILHNLGSQMGSNLRYGLQQKPPHVLSNGSLNDGIELIGSNLQITNEPAISASYMPCAPCPTAPKPLLHHLDHHQRPPMHGDAYGMNNGEAFGAGGFPTTGTETGVGSVMNSQNLNCISLSSMPAPSTSEAVASHSSLHMAQQAAFANPQLVDQTEKINTQSSQSLGGSLLQSHEMQTFHQYPPHFQQKQQLVQHQSLQKQLNQQNQHLLGSNPFGHSELVSDLTAQMKHGPILGLFDSAIHAQSMEPLQMSELQTQIEQYAVEDQARGNQNLSLPSENPVMPVAESSQKTQQILHPRQLASGSAAQNQWHPQLQNGSSMAGSKLPGQHKPGADLCGRVSGGGQDGAHHAPLKSPTNTHKAHDMSTEPHGPCGGGAALASGDAIHDRRHWDQVRWILFLRHARQCTSPEGECPAANCIKAKKLWVHMDGCHSSRCSNLLCNRTRSLIEHHRHCMEVTCPVCIPVKTYIKAQKKVQAASPNLGLKNKLNNEAGDNSSIRLASKAASVEEEEGSEDLQPCVKRMKIERSFKSPKHGNEAFAMPAASDANNPHAAQLQEFNQGGGRDMVKAEHKEMKADAPSNYRLESPSLRAMKMENDGTDQMHHGEYKGRDGLAVLDGIDKIKSEKEGGPVKQENATHTGEMTAAAKSGKPKIKGVSLTELFTPEQVREHITGLRQWVGQSKAKAEKNKEMERLMSENSCQLCAVEKLTFEPPPLYCTLCGVRIKRNAMYYTMGAGDTRHCFCIPCYNDARGDVIAVDGTNISKVKLEKKKNDEETEEWWVQCDKCEAWQHQICALFNGRRNDGGQAEYTCPNCYIEEVERGERKPLPLSAVLGAKDLPRTILSDHIEQWLSRRLKHERQERANYFGKSFDEVPGAEALVIRVVSSVDKKLEVKQRFLEIFREDNYPVEFAYKSKVILLFQKIEGVEVCLFGMYVQEFGSESQFPNQRRVYLSYLDSVKYFRPDVRTVAGEALRTFVYHEILIGYLDYCKKRGFTSCYIWACPPLKGEDYILYCHPEIQKTPKSDKLREWYLSMLRKAAKENIVVDLTNLYDHFFVTTGECKAKVTAARLPYFDGDYWPGAAEDLIYQLNQEEDSRRQNKKGTTKKIITKRALKASGQLDLLGNASKDLLLMHKLGETISPMKEDFIMVHLQHCCTHCCILMVSGHRWICKQCKNFQICNKCYEAEQKNEERERHPVYQREKHMLYPVEIADVPADTKDKDDVLESEFFDTRQAFLSLCQGNHYQYDTLRRAKHSSMMVLYHLHNPTAPAFVTTCNICHLDIETGQGWRCEICPDYDVCNACYQKDGGTGHPHNLTNLVDHNAQSKEARQLRVLQLRKMLDLLVHASQCGTVVCQYPNCRKVKGVFRHGMQCKTRLSGGCVVCKKMWYLLQLHSRACNKSVCHVPRCRDLREHVRRLQQQSDSRRRAAVKEMMRQRAAEVAANCT